MLWDRTDQEILAELSLAERTFLAIKWEGPIGLDASPLVCDRLRSYGLMSRASYAYQFTPRGERIRDLVIKQRREEICPKTMTDSETLGWKRRARRRRATDPPEGST